MTTERTKPIVVIIGAGPAGLMAAEVLSQFDAQIDVYDAMPSPGRKFLLAGVGGMNITHAEPFADFVLRYAERAAQLQPWLQAFGPDAIRDWAAGLGIATFIGSSGRVFPQDMKAAPLLRAWLHRLRQAGVRLHVRHRWQGWDNSGALCFQCPAGELKLRPDVTLLALGGGSWPRLGSDAAWVPRLRARDIEVTPLRPANCGFETAWSEVFRRRWAGQPMKRIGARLAAVPGTVPQTGECVVTHYGLEGGLIYALSADLRRQLEVHGQVELQLDLLPDRRVERIAADLSRPRGKRSFSNHLRRAGLAGVKAALLRERAAPGLLQDPDGLARYCKAVPLTLTAPRPLDEAISSAGGVRLEALDEHLMLHNLPGVFCAGEMLDWEAPTGGYLLTACLASGRAAGQGMRAWLQR